MRVTKLGFRHVPSEYNSRPGCFALYFPADRLFRRFERLLTA